MNAISRPAAGVYFNIQGRLTYAPAHKLMYRQEDAFTHRDTISVEASVCAQFRLKNYGDVRVRRIEDKTSVTLDLIELHFREQYITRSDMYRLRRRLLDTCVHVNKKVEHYGGCAVCVPHTHGCRHAHGSRRPVARRRALCVWLCERIDAHRVSK
jgi:hypothetical protein